MKVLEMFAGIGSQIQALKNLGIEVESTISEIDKFAIKSYMAIHGETPNLGDITKIEHIPQVDLLTYSFPCQDLSIAWKGPGMRSGTRSSLLWEVGRLLQDAKQRGTLPHYLLMENVDAILNKKNIANFEKWMDELEALGYTNSYKVLNAKDFGVPQNRKRCFMVSSLDGKKFVFPGGEPLTKCLRDVLEDPDKIDDYYLPYHRVQYYEQLRAADPNDKYSKITIVGDLHSPGRLESANRVYSIDGLCATIPTGAGGGHIPRIFDDGIRYITPLESWRLMGFPDEAFYKAKDAGISKTQLYKQAGNSIVVNVLEAIFKGMFITDSWE